jgi:hypothetical protein
MARFINSLSTAYMVGKAVWNVVKTQPVSPDSPMSTKYHPYRPSRWSKFDSEGMLLREQSWAAIFEDRIAEGQASPYGYYFDAFLSENHEGSVRITDHPVQTGTNISDHAYNMPDTLTVDILVSDVMDVFYAGQFSGGLTKSISAYEKLRELKEKRQPLSVTTRLRTYDNMVIENMSTRDTYKTSESLRCSVSFRQILTATVFLEKVSLKTSTKEEQRVGSKTPQPIQDSGSALNNIAEIIQGFLGG